MVEEVYKQGNQVATRQTMTSLPGRMRLSLNLREVRKEGRDTTLYLSIATRVYPLLVPAYSENQFLHSMPHPPFSNLNQIILSFTHPPPPTPAPLTASCTLTDVTSLDNPISSPSSTDSRFSEKDPPFCWEEVSSYRYQHFNHSFSH